MILEVKIETQLDRVELAANLSAPLHINIYWPSGLFTTQDIRFRVLLNSRMLQISYSLQIR